MKISFVIVFLLLALPFNFNAQTSGEEQEVISYTYDPSGNRVLRKVITIVLRPSDTTSNDDALLSEELIKDSLSNEQNNFENSEVFEDNLGGYKVSIYPNPTKGKLSLEIPEISSANQAILRIYDVMGKTLKDISISTTITDVDLTQYNDGSYILFLNINGNTSQWTIVKIN